VSPVAGDAIRVVLVDESPVQRALLRRSLQDDGDIVVVAEASTFAGAAGAVARGEPDVVALGTGRAGGEEAAIARIMGRTPRPILVVDGRAGPARTTSGHPAIAAGAASVIGLGEDGGAALRRRVRVLRHRSVGPAGPAGPVASTPAVPSPPGGLPIIVAIASSTGGPSALEEVLRGIRGQPVAVVLVQHIDRRLVGGFADWLEKVTGWPVAVAVEGTPPKAGVVHIGPGGRHLELDARGLFAHRDEPKSVHMPSADRLFASLAATAADRVVAAILTGMGADGAAGLLALKQAGARTIAQDESSSAVFGMARAALELGAVSHSTPLVGIAPAIIRTARSQLHAMGAT
jgi:two-component system chemotaxis response regulator CheB